MLRTIAIASTILLVGCEARPNETVYLYRSTVAGSPSESIHVASFDAKDGRAYNEENCMIVRGLMERQPGVVVGYWCTDEAP